MNATDWLPDSDPSVRWPTLRELTDAPDEAVAVERAKVGYHCDMLRGLDYRQAAEPEVDERWAEAIGLVQSRREPDGLRALRVLRWSNDGQVS